MKDTIIPALMPNSFDEIHAASISVRGEVSVIQLDIMDGKYVPEPTWPFVRGGGRDIQDILNEDTGLPLWEDIGYEIDLMVRRPEEELGTWLGLGASRVIFHYASVHDWGKIKEIDPVVRNFLDLGVAVTIHDNIEKVYELIDTNTVDFIQCMGIARIGYQGEPFDESVLELIASIRSRYPDIIISVDGGVNEDTIQLLKEAGVDRFVAGSAVFGSGIAKENIEYLADIIKT